ncbi:MAG TPA: hypothetical protein VHY31_15170 [Streptosporangiaceae bacterium]|nr:hypothetical protein [Streptosporangiaceae bacterium]
MLPWLYAIAGNAVRDQRRSAGRRSRLAAGSFAALTNALAADGLYADGLQAHPVVGCWPGRQGRRADQQALRGNGLTGWRIVVRPFPTASSCAADAPDSASHTVLILGA